MTSITQSSLSSRCSIVIFFFHDTPTTCIYTLSLHDALPISLAQHQAFALRHSAAPAGMHRALRGVGHPHVRRRPVRADRKSTRLNSSHTVISYAVFCLKKKKKNE